MNSQHRDVKTAMDRLQRVFGHKPSRSSVMSGLYDLKQGAREDYRKFSGRFERVLGDLRDFSAPIPPDETLNMESSTRPPFCQSLEVQVFARAQQNTESPKNRMSAFSCKFWQESGTMQCFSFRGSQRPDE